MTAELLAILAHALAVAITLWSGRALRAEDDSITAARWAAYDSRSALLLFCSFAVLLGALELSPLWVLALFVELLLVRFPARRQVFHERWSLGKYLGFQLRYICAFGGFWLALGLLPALVHALPMPLTAATLLAAALGFAILWAPIDLRLRWVGAAPLTGAALTPECERVLAQARTARPELWVLRDHGNRFANAFALPSEKAPRVLFGHTLLSELTSDEAAAVLAHEVAHLEQFDPARLRRWGWTFTLLMLVAALIVPACAVVAVRAPGEVTRIWAWFVLVGWLVFASSRRHDETHADARALELGIDVETMISALTQLHVLGRQPRRVDLNAEALRSHPSLARRIRALRKLAAPSVAAPQLTPFAVLERKRARAALRFELDRLWFLHGLPEGARLDDAGLPEQATRVESFAYEDLASAALQQHWNGPVLTVTLRNGECRRFDVRTQDWALVQAALDQVDGRFSAAPPPLRDRALRALMLVVSAGVIWATFALHLPYVLLLFASLALAPACAAHSRSLAAAVLAAFAFLVLRADGADGADNQVRPFYLLLPLLAALAWAGALRAARSTHSPAASQLSLLLVCVPAWIAVLAALPLWTDLFTVHWTMAHSGVVPVLGLGAAALVLGRGGRRWRWTFAAMGCSGVLALLAGSGAFRTWVLRDPFLQPARPLQLVSMKEPPPTPLFARSLSHLLTAESVSPDGKWIVASEHDSEERLVPGFVVMDPDDQRQTSAAHRLVLIDNERALALFAADMWSLRVQRLATPLVTESELLLPRLADADSVELTFEAGRYRLSECSATGCVVLTGLLGQPPDKQLRQHLPPGAQQQLPVLATRSMDRELVPLRLRRSAAALLGVRRVPQTRRVELSTLADDSRRARVLARTWLDPECVEQHQGSQRLWCMVDDRRHTTLFELDTQSGALTPIGRLPGRGYDLRADAFRSGHFGLQLDSHMVVVRVDTRTALTLDGCDRPPCATSAKLMQDSVATARHCAAETAIEVYPRGPWLDP